MATRRSSGVWGQVAFYTSLGFIIPGSAIAGLVIGWLADRWLTTEPAGTVIGGVAGAAAGVYEVIRILTRAQAQQNDNQGNDTSARPG